MKKIPKPKLFWLLLSVLFTTGCLMRSVVQDSDPLEGSADVIFARAMSVHHAQAVEMSLNIRDRSRDEELRLLALDIILTQHNQVGQMTGWLAVWGLPNAAPVVTAGTSDMSRMAHSTGNMAMPGMAAQKDINALTSLPIVEAERSYLKLMILHHEGGIKMAQDALVNNLRPEVRRLAESIVRGQQSEISYLQSLLAKQK